MSWSTSELRVRLAPLNRFKPSSKIFYWLFQGGTSFVDLLCFCSVLCLLCICARLFICVLWSPAGKGLTSWLSFVVSTVSLWLSHWHPGSGVVLDCIDSWSLHPYLLFKIEMLSTTFCKCAVLFQSWNYKEWNLIFWFLSISKLRRITHRFNIKPFGLYSICEWFAGVYTSIKTKNKKFLSYIKA